MDTFLIPTTQLAVLPSPVVNPGVIRGFNPQPDPPARLAFIGTFGLK